MLVLSRRRFLIILFSFFLAQVLPFATTSKGAFSETQREVGGQDSTSMAESTEPIQQETNRSNLSQQKDKQAKITLLYHTDPDVRSNTILAIAELHDSKLTDDLIRAFSVEFYTPVLFVYESALPSLTGMKRIKGRSAWKSWLATEVQNGRLNIDYVPVDVNSLDLEERFQIQSLAFRLDAKYFKEMAEILTTGGDDRAKFTDALRYMIANDHKNDVRQFFHGNWLRNHFQKRDIDIRLCQKSHKTVHLWPM